MTTIVRPEVDEIGYAVAELADLDEKAAQAGLSSLAHGLGQSMERKRVPQFVP
ncbi:hypothetical protein LTR16_001972, partial [Cryomyces antarcticus]